MVNVLFLTHKPANVKTCTGRRDLVNLSGQFLLPFTTAPSDIKALKGPVRDRRGVSQKSTANPERIAEKVGWWWAALVMVAVFSSCNFSENGQGAKGDIGGDPKAQAIAARAIQVAGGLENYTTLREIRYTKRSILYKSDGTVESDLRQQHHYNLVPELSGEIKWFEGDTPVKIEYASDKAEKIVDETLIEGSAESAKQTFLSNYYVLFMPFKLADPGVKLTYVGRVVLDTGEPADVVKAEYEPSNHDNHSTGDVWWYYFDAEQGNYLASMVYHSPTYAYIENSRTTGDSLRLKLNAFRRSYRCDSLRNKEFLRGEFWYSDFALVY